MPSQVIANYSGEENRLFALFYKPFYDSFKKRFLKTGEFSNISQKLFFVNKYFWQLALLSLIYKNKEGNVEISNFFSEILGIQEINDITFSFNTSRFKHYSETETIKFVKSINPGSNKEITISFDELMDGWNWSTDKYFFNLLSTAYLPADIKIIDSIKITYNQTLDSSCFSEGEKKLILMQFILEVLADEETLILFDEPDSHIHVSRKETIKMLLEQYDSRECVLTTHSPTLMKCFGMDHLLTLTKDDNNIVQVDNSFVEVKDIMENITEGLWTIEDQNILHFTSKDILLVEGKSDERFISEALARLKKTHDKYKSLEFFYLPCGGADGVKSIMKKFKPKAKQTIIAFFDSDKEGWQKINQVFEEEKRYNSNNFSKMQKDSVWVAAYPKKDLSGNDNFIIEDYFPVDIIKNYFLSGLNGINTIKSSSNIKRLLEKNCHEYEDSAFLGFEKLFELIIEIKSEIQ